MGAAASVRMLYKDSLGWFKQFVDTETYMTNFKEMDRHHENGLSFADVQHWITVKGKTDPGWTIFLTSGPVLSIAHKFACKHGDTHTSVSEAKMVNVTEFKTLLVNLYAFSVLWSHFQNAEKWEESGADVASNKLNFEAFRLACRTFDAANAHEELSDAIIRADFELIDANFSGSVGFIEVCNHCSIFIDDPDIEKKISISIPKFFGDSPNMIRSDSLLTSLEEGPKTYYEVATIDQKNHEMVEALLLKLSNQKDSLKSASALEHQNNIRKKYRDIDDMLENPLCFGFFLQFCTSQHNAENLSFIREVDEFRDMFSCDTDLWVNAWRDTDITVNISGDLDESRLSADLWTSNLPKHVAMAKVEMILEKYLHDDACTQVCISKDFIGRTLKRIKLLDLYGPSVFDEACVDPITTMKKDILPRFKDSDIVNTMVMRVASCEPPPPAAEFRTPPPDSLLLNLYSSDAFPDTRCFTLDEIIGNQNLYQTFLNYLSRNKYKTELLVCIRRIDIFDELMVMNCMKEATDEAWLIYRYYVALNCAYFVAIPDLDRKKLMHQLAVPKKNMFSGVRTAAYVLLKPNYDMFARTPDYKGLPKMMREVKSEQEDRGGADVVSELPPIRGLRTRDDSNDLSPRRSPHGSNSNSNSRGNSIAETLLSTLNVRGVLRPSFKERHAE